MKVILKQSDKHEEVTLKSLARVSTSLDKIMKQSYLSITNKPSGKAPELKIYVNNLRSGSVIFELAEKAISNPETLQIAFAGILIKPKEIFNVAQNAMKFWSLFDKLIKNGEIPTVNITENKGTAVTFIALNGSTISVDPLSFKTAMNISESGKELTSSIRNGDLQSISFGAKSSVTFDETNMDCFSTTSKSDVDAMPYPANVISFNKDSRSGTLSFIEDLQERKCSFSVNSGELVGLAIDALKANSCRVLALREYVETPNGKKHVIRLQVVGFD